MPARSRLAALTAAAGDRVRWLRLQAAGLLVVGSFGLAAPDLHATPSGPPPAPVRTVTETMYGVPVPDPYRHLEDVTDPAVAAWMKAQGRHTATTLARIPARAALVERILRYDAGAAEEVAQVVRVPGDGFFAERRASSEGQFRLTLRQGLDGVDRVLVDPAVLEKKTGRPQSINWYAPSPDGRLLAYGLSQPGSEAAALHLMDVATGKRLGRPVGRAELGPVDWSPDGRVLLFNRLRPARPGALPTERYLRSQVLDPAEPVSIGAMVGPEAFMEVRYLAHAKQLMALDAIPRIAGEFAERFGRASGGLVRGYRCEDATTIVVALGSVIGTLADCIDELRADGLKVGVLGIRSFRPFPLAAVRAALQGAERVVVLEKSFSVGLGGVVSTDVRVALSGLQLHGYTVVAGLGGRAITKASLARTLREAVADRLQPLTFMDLDWRMVQRQLEREARTRRSGPVAENLLRDVGAVASRVS